VHVGGADCCSFDRWNFSLAPLSLASSAEILSGQLMLPLFGITAEFMKRTKYLKELMLRKDEDIRDVTHLLANQGQKFRMEQQLTQTMTESSRRSSRGLISNFLPTRQASCPVAKDWRDPGVIENFTKTSFLFFLPFCLFANSLSLSHAHPRSQD